MATPYEDLYAAAVALVDLGTSYESAPTNYGDDFRPASGTSAYSYQVRIEPMALYYRSSTTYPRALVTIQMHHVIADFANEKSFAHAVIYTMASTVFDVAQWKAQSGIFGFEPETEPEMDEGERVGNVLTFTFTATILMDAV